MDNIKTVTGNLNKIQKKQNILALNASIEAARAGEHGRGFSVVAQEVETLSRNSKQLNNQIFEYVENIYQIVHDMMKN